MIYITDLAAYNSGYLIGRWITLPMPHEELAGVIQEVLTHGMKTCQDTQPHEEVFITDSEADITIGEYDGIHLLNELAEFMEEYTEHDLLKLRFLSSEGYNEHNIIKEGLDSFEVDIYDYSEDTSFTDVYELLAYDFVDEGLFGEIPVHLEHYIDYSAIGRDLSMDYTEFEHGVLGKMA